MMRGNRAVGEEIGGRNSGRRRVKKKGEEAEVGKNVGKRVRKGRVKVGWLGRRMVTRREAKGKHKGRSNLNGI